ncbi:B12-binding domain-containing radical SAM protein [Candidatus Margulisiibacteriota bacterium]
MSYFKKNNLIDAKLENRSEKIRTLFIIASDEILPFSGVHQGVATLAGICEVNNVFVKVIDYTVTDLDLNILKNYICENRFNLVGISASTCSVNTAYRIARFIKEIDSSIWVIMGGPHVSELMSEPLSNGVDLVFVGESELQFVKFLGQLPDLLNSDQANRIAVLKDIKGTAFLDEEGKCFFSGRQERIRELDLIPYPARHYFPYPQKYGTAFRAFPGNSARIITSRGCNGHCFFCNKKIFSGQITFRSPDNVIEEIRHILTAYGKIKQIDFVDENFLEDPDRIIRIAEMIKKNRFNVEWAAGNTRVDCDVDLEYFKFLRKCGCYRIAFGVESGSQRVIDGINKKINLNQVERIVKLANKAGLFTACFFIIGNHCEKEEDIKQTIEFAKKLSCDAVNFTINTPFPGTPLWHYLNKKNLMLTKDWNVFGTYSDIIFKHEHVSREKILLYYSKAYKEFYLRPMYFWGQVKKFVLTRGRYWHLYYSALAQTFSKLLGGLR